MVDELEMKVNFNWLHKIGAAFRLNLEYKIGNDIPTAAYYVL